MSFFLKEDFKVLVIVCSLAGFLINEINAQSYHPFPESNAEWNIVWYKDPEGYIGDNPYLVQYKYRILKDTLIEGKTYQIFTKTTYNTECSNDSTFERVSFYIRNDINNKLAFYFNGTDEYLLYNFNLELGDTLQGYQFINEPDYSVYYISQIDSIVIEGEYFMRYKVNCTNNPDFPVGYLMEGIGYTWGIIEDVPTGFWPFYELRCCHINNSLVYSYSYTNECNLETDTCLVDNRQIIKNETFTLAPNPATNTITVKLNNTTDILEFIEIELLDITGKTILNKKQSCNGNTFSLDISSLPDGLILIKVKTNTRTYIRKVIHL
jgi:hypothetical protein